MQLFTTLAAEVVEGQLLGGNLEISVSFQPSHGTFPQLLPSAMLSTLPVNVLPYQLVNSSTISVTLYYNRNHPQVNPFDLKKE